MVAHVEILAEEPSMEAALRTILPKMIGEISFAIYTYQGKQDLLNKLSARLRGYVAWLPEDWRIVVIVDRDDDHCTELKTTLEDAADHAGLQTRTRGHRATLQVVNRLAVEELEAWFFGDWAAVQAAYPRVEPNIPSKTRYRNPDAIIGTWEALERILQRAGYFRTGLRKIEAARAIAQYMEPQRNRSVSFRVLQSALDEMAT